MPPLADYPQLQQMTLTELLTSEDNKLASLQEEARESIHNNGGGVYNHQLYFDSMRSLQDRSPVELWRRRWSGILDR